MTDDGFGFDDDLFDDDGFGDVFDDIDDDAGFGGTQDIQQALEDFDVEVQRQIKILRSNKKFSSSERAEAARWLGESGSWQAIPSLVMIYQKDKKNKEVQNAAKYALGQFKALDKAIKRKKGAPVAPALEDPKNQKIYEQLIDIAVNDKRGKKLRVPTTVLWVLTLILLISFGVFAYLGYTTYNENEANRKYAAQFAELTGTPEQVAVAELQILISDARDDARSIRQQLNGSLDCDATYNSPIDYELDEAIAGSSPEIADLATQYNAANEQLRQTRSAVDTACANDNQFDSETLLADIGVTIEELNSVRDAANELSAEIDTGLQEEADAATATANAQATENAVATAEASITPTLTLTLTPTPGIPPEALRTEVNILYRIVSDSSDAISVLRTYWENVRDTGETIGCSRPVELIPEDHELPENYGIWNTDLQNAAELTNGSLALVRDSWEQFTTACTEGTLSESVDVGLLLVDLAEQASNEAEQSLNELSGFGSGLEDFQTPTPEASN